MIQPIKHNLSYVLMDMYTEKLGLSKVKESSGGRGVIMACTGRLCPKGVPFSGFMYIKE